MKIGNFEIGRKVFIVCEMGASHCRSLEVAREIIYLAKSAGADAVKIQIFEPHDLAVNVAHPIFQIKEGLWKGRSLYDLYSEAALPLDFVQPLKAYADNLGILFFPTIYSVEKIAFAEQFNFPAYKVASFENTEISLVKALAATSKPLIISTGGMSYTDIWALSRHIKEHRLKTIWLKCTSNYPSKAENLRTIPELSRLRRYAGLSDHSNRIETAVIATVLGACLIEAHIYTDARSLDAGFAYGPNKFTELVQAVRFTEAALGAVKFDDLAKRWLKRIDYNGKRVRAIID